MLESTRRGVAPGVLTALVAALLVAWPSGPAAHEIPSDVTVQAFVKPEGRRLRMLVRVPLEAMRDVEFPTYGIGYLDIAQADASLREAATLWIVDYVELYEGTTRLEPRGIVAVQVSLPSDRSFDTFEGALAHVTTGPRLPDDTELYWNQALLDVLIDYPIESDRAEFSIRPGFEWLGLRVNTALRFLPPGGAIRAFEYSGNPGLVRLDPRWHQAAWRFVELGFEHILDGIDHLLFLACLVIPFRRIRPLIVVVTSFTIAHSVTLLASAFNLAPNALWFPPLVETLIAMSIVYMALENIVGANFERRWLITFAFGLVHGFGFSFALRQTLQFAGSHMLTSLLSFNVGVELGQIFVLVLLVPLLDILFRYMVAERIGTILLSALVAHNGWHWMTERGAALSQFQFQWPVLDVTLLVTGMRWLMLLLIVGGLIWLMSGVLDRLGERGAGGETAARAEK